MSNRTVEGYEAWIERASMKWIWPWLKEMGQQAGVPSRMIGDMMKIKYNSRSPAEAVICHLRKKGFVMWNRAMPDGGMVYLVFDAKARTMDDPAAGPPVNVDMNVTNP